MACTGIAANISFDCNSTANNTGVQDTCVLFRWSEIDRGSSSFDATNPLKLESLGAVSSPLVGYSYTSGLNAIRPGWEKVADGFNPNKFIHRVTLPVYGDTATKNYELTKLVGDKVIAVDFSNAETIHVYGWASGLIVSTLTRDTVENEGRFDLVLQSAEGISEPYPPFFYTGAASPEADFETLKAEILAFVA